MQTYSIVIFTCTSYYIASVNSAKDSCHAFIDKKYISTHFADLFHDCVRLVLCVQLIHWVALHPNRAWNNSWSPINDRQEIVHGRQKRRVFSQEKKHRESHDCRSPWSGTFGSLFQALPQCALLYDFTLSNTRRFCSSKGEVLVLNGINMDSFPHHSTSSWL